MRDTITLHLEMFRKEHGTEPQTVMRIAIDNDWREYRDKYCKEPMPEPRSTDDIYYLHDLERWKQREKKRQEYIDALAKQLALALYDKY